MRAVCEVCSRPQPVDWKPADLCVHCGQAVRRERRCFWCAKWTPAGKYCRRCGAAVVDDERYGAARMLRDAGTDRFTVPRMLVELDPEQIENFTRIYQRHAAVMRRHMDHVRFLETFLQQRPWSEALEDELTAQLPWPEERLDALAAAMEPEIAAGRRDRAESLRTAQAIHSSTPFPATRQLAALVRLILDDWSAQREALSVFSAPDSALRHEAALALTGWRVLSGPGLSDSGRDLIEALRQSPFRVQAAVRLALLGDKASGIPAEAFTFPDPDVRFMAALAAGRTETLIAAARSEDEMERFAAASRLIGLDIFAPVGDAIHRAEPACQSRLLRELAYRRKPAPELRETLYEIAAAASGQDILRAAVQVLCYGCPPQEVERLAAAAKGDSNSYQSILQRANLAPDSLERLGVWFLRHGVFKAEQYGMRDIAKRGRMPPEFVPRRWEAADEKARIELCRFAEYQLEEYADEELLKFLVSAAFAPGSVPARVALWTSIYRWHRRLDISDAGPLRIESESLTRFFGSVAAFTDVFTKFLRDPSTAELLGQMTLYDRVAHLLRYADDQIFEILASNPQAGLPLASALVAVAENTAFDFLLRIECLGFLGKMGSAPELREKMREAITAFAGSDLDYASKTALERLNA
ncbi:MAG TPA: hypothetical protein VL285_11545 [Bryobacteraceae bacterium]|jgi:hypothetical protein|nr:hypothetical protein [Bryobacteraceae bacterium]